MFSEFNTFVFVGLHSVQTNKKRSVKNNYKLAMYSRHQMFIVDFCILTQLPMDVWNEWLPSVKSFLISISSLR